MLEPAQLSAPLVSKQPRLPSLVLSQMTLLEDLAWNKKLVGISTELHVVQKNSELKKKKLTGDFKTTMDNPPVINQVVKHRQPICLLLLFKCLEMHVMT